MRVLIANRGEISCRAQRACALLGLPCVAVFTQPDAQSLHVLQAVESFCLGTSPKAYLDPDLLLAACSATGELQWDSCPSDRVTTTNALFHNALWHHD
jgi:acetyl/propionyl-CoA carboxylase alpha subunit